MGWLAECARYQFSGSNVGNVTVPITTAVGTGKTILLSVNAPALNAITNFTATDTKGNTWVQDSFGTAGTVVNGQCATLRCTVTTALTTSDTVNIVAVTRSPDKWAVLANSFDDIFTTSPLDKTATPATGISSAVASGTTAATAQAYELVYNTIALTGLPGVTVGSGYTAGGAILTSSPASSPRSVFVQWKYVSATGTQNATATLDASQTWVSLLTTYKSNTPAPPVTYDTYVVKGGVWAPATVVFG